MSKKMSKSLAIIKYNNVKLRGGYQLPLFLSSCIDKLTKEDKEDYVSFLLSQCELYMRVKGFYKKYPSLDREYSELIKKELKERSYL